MRTSFRREATGQRKKKKERKKEKKGGKERKKGGLQQGSIKDVILSIGWRNADYQ